MVYTQPLEHLSDELKKLDIILELELLQMNAAPRDASPFNEIPGLFVSASEVKSLLDEEDHEREYTPAQVDQLRRLELSIAARLRDTEQQGTIMPLPLLRMRFELSDLEIRALIVAVAPHVSRKYVKLYGYLMDDLSKPELTVDLMLRLCCRNAEERRTLIRLMVNPSAIFQTFFIRQGTKRNSTGLSLLESSIKLHDRFVSYLLGLEYHYEGSLANIQLHHPDQFSSLPPLLTNHQLQSQMVQYAKHVQDRAVPTILLLHGPSGSGQTFHARHACASLGRTLLAWDMSHAPEEESALIDAIERMLLEAKLLDAIPAFDHLHRWQSSLSQTSSKEDRLARLIERLVSWSGLIFMLSEEEVKPILPSPTMIWLDIPLTIPDIGERQHLWQSLTGDSLALSPSEADNLAGKFLFTPGKIAATVNEVRRLEEWRRLTAGELAEMPSVSDQLHQAAYHLISHRLVDKAVKLEPRFNWDDLILPQETLQLLWQACSRVEYRRKVMYTWGFNQKLPYGKGISMLFTGPPGTGKTMSALVMAKEMNAELYRVDLSRVVSKYIGETEKNLSDIFDQAHLSGAILFFDEADALFGKRSEVKDAHDKYANMETSYLLQKMEEYEGLTILATNFAQNLDDAFTRRIQFIVKYPFPDAIQREQLWRATFPKQLPVEELDYPFLSQTFELSGGSIKNIVLTAAYLAAREDVPVSMKQLIEGVIQEYKKTGKVLLKDRLGAYAD